MEKQSNKFNEAQLGTMIENIKESIKQEFATELLQKTSEIQELQKELLQLKQRLDPLIKFEPILTKNIKEPLQIQLFNLPDTDKETLFAISRQYYKRLSKRFENGEKSAREPLNQLMSDVVAWAMKGSGGSRRLSVWLKQRKQQHLIINDPL